MKGMSCCGMVCVECEFYPYDCQGCDAVKGAPFWVSYFGADICERYHCCRNVKKWDTCTYCKDLPCEYYYIFDPTKTKAENEAILARQLENLQQLRDFS